MQWSLEVRVLKRVGAQAECSQHVWAEQERVQPSLVSGMEPCTPHIVIRFRSYDSEVFSAILLKRSQSN